MPIIRYEKPSLGGLNLRSFYDAPARRIRNDISGTPVAIFLEEMFDEAPLVGRRTPTLEALVQKSDFAEKICDIADKHQDVGVLGSRMKCETCIQSADHPNSLAELHDLRRLQRKAKALFVFVPYRLVGVRNECVNRHLDTIGRLA